MKNPELFHKTVGILVNAYLNDTLVHGDCFACAVGNICAGNGIPKGNAQSNWLLDENKLNNALWGIAFKTCNGRQQFHKKKNKGNVKKVIKATGYNMVDLAKIEYAFETCPVGNNDYEHIFNGLMSVCDTLMQIHEATTEQTEQAKSLFKKELAEVG